MGALNRVLSLPFDFDAEIRSSRWSSGRYSSWNIAKYCSAIELPHIALYADHYLWCMCAVLRCPLWLLSVQAVKQVSLAMLSPCKYSSAPSNWLPTGQLLLGRLCRFLKVRCWWSRILAGWVVSAAYAAIVPDTIPVKAGVSEIAEAPSITKNPARMPSAEDRPCKNVCLNMLVVRHHLTLTSAEEVCASCLLCATVPDFPFYHSMALLNRTMHRMRDGTLWTTFLP